MSTSFSLGQLKIKKFIFEFKSWLLRQQDLISIPCFIRLMINVNYAAVVKTGLGNNVLHSLIRQVRVDANLVKTELIADGD